MSDMINIPFFCFQGDSGGPLIVGTGEDGRNQVVGKLLHIIFLFLFFGVVFTDDSSKNGKITFFAMNHDLHDTIFETPRGPRGRRQARKVESPSCAPRGHDPHFVLFSIGVAGSRAHAF